ncbi:SusC/RagA family TonB-linked outer membrane protein [Mucilaginibacter sp. SJ]|uniref:SusC/RagA family TonB-linked outer membrane protein n=1 Tax=Mucilaginibacter sp. SJ TaxID=3029053 RepID=UPI0023A94CCF|nr:TonB-dependent receptor [Mucilaginibacter sp. SJ]WEA00620.1 TonB-dependent receptor [Mucilaginibacter sp. SJ]
MNKFLPFGRGVGLNTPDAKLQGIMHRLCFIVCFLLFGLSSFAQQKVTGKVMSGDSIIVGASIRVKGAANGTQTDASGKFVLDAPSNATLVVSYIGYQNAEVSLKGRTFVTIQLQQSLSQIKELVVVGYSTQSKHKMTSAVATVSGEALNRRVGTDPTSLLQGQLPGLQVTQGSGEPGAENVELRIRGVGTFSGAGNAPLVIVDGLPGSIDVINPNDIESVTLLKDAASAAIYGSRGANGVIVIKTKRGKNGPASVQYSYNYGIANATKLPDIITNSAEFMRLSNEANVNSGRQPLYTQAQIDLYANATDRVKYPNHNWLNDVFKPAHVQNHYLSVNGGSDESNYNIGLGYTNQPGTMIGFDYNKYTIDLGLSTKVNKRITIGTNLQGRYGYKVNPRQGAQDQFLSTLAQSPLYPPQASNGDWIKRAYPNEQGNKNPVAIVGEDVRNRNNDYYFQGNIFLNVDIIPGLAWENKAGGNYDTFNNNDFRPVIPMYYYNDMSSAGYLDVGTPGLYVNRGDNSYLSYYSQLNFKKQFGKHNISALGGFQQEVNKYGYLSAWRQKFTTNLLRELDAGPTDGMNNSGTSSKWAIRSFYGNLNYDYNDKYLFGSSVRYDGTSRLPANSRWGLFYSFSAAWRLSAEEFMKPLTWINDLKIRGSWGQLGNQNIGTYPYQASLDNRSYAFNGAVTPGYSASTLVDPSLTWETTRVFDLGIDLTAFNNKLTFTADWFNKYTFNILRSSQIPLWVGLNAPTINDGALRNKGVELAIQYRDKINQDWSFSVGGNFQSYRNKLEKYGATEIGYNTIRQEGHALDDYYMYVWDGIFQSQQEIDNSPKQPVTPTPGDLKFKDVNGDGVINDKDRTYVGGKYPSFQYTGNIGLTWRKFDMNAMFYGSVGQKIYVNGWGIEPFRQGSVPTKDWENRWTPTNHTNTMPKIYIADGYAPVQNYPSTYFLKNASFFRLKSLQIGYSLPKELANKITMKSARIYFSADNVFTVSKFPGLDPERVGDGNYVTYPQNRIFTLGASVQF